MDYNPKFDGPDLEILTKLINEGKGDTPRGTLKQERRPEGYPLECAKCNEPKEDNRLSFEFCLECSKLAPVTRRKYGKELRAERAHLDYLKRKKSGRFKPRLTIEQRAIRQQEIKEEQHNNYIRRKEERKNNGKKD